MSTNPIKDEVVSMRKPRKKGNKYKFFLLCLCVLYAILVMHTSTQSASIVERVVGEPTIVQEPSSFPPLHSIMNLQTGEIIGDPQFLLDFAVVGHGKCGTTTILTWLLQNADRLQLHMPPDELLQLSMGTRKQFVGILHNQFSKSADKKLHGYKNPGEIRIPRSIRFLDLFFPKTLLIVGIRHPILWFQSLYNFKVQNLPPKLSNDYFGDPNQLVGECTNPRIFSCVGTAKGLFHVHLAMLGKTNQTSMLESKYASLLGGNITKTRNPVFLFDVDQLRDDNITRSTEVGQVLSHLLHGQASSLGPPPRISPGKTLNERQQKRRDKGKIQICEEKYVPLRTELMTIAREASVWIRTSGFLDNPDVHVASRDYLEYILEHRWMRDPCDAQIPPSHNMTRN
eukprot:Nitzschia sp. Nitz4//scaffold29_size155292//77494//78687//NITZ4_002663-RA/size155292-processed-gene-0.288-mRNA-1//-1//CDS//3329546463//5394//frame0